eukprot:3491487-Karenia_brevis.AAC.1
MDEEAALDDDNGLARASPNVETHGVPTKDFWLVPTLLQREQRSDKIAPVGSSETSTPAWRYVGVD